MGRTHGAGVLMTEFTPCTSRRGVLAGVAGLALSGWALAGCGRGRDEPSRRPAAQSASGPREGTLEWALAGDWRAADRPRDRWRHPEEVLEFFDLRPNMTVVEFWPGKGYWTEILGPYLARNDGTLYAANFQIGPNADPAQAQIVQRYKDRFGGNRKLYGDVKMTEFGPTSGPVTAPNTADLVMFMQTVNEWMAAGIADKAFRDAYAALKPGGILAVEQHRADIGGLQDPAATSGYVQEPYVKQLAAEAGFAFAGSSEVNANPKDTKDHPFGVWTLPPTRASAPRGQPDNPDFNHAKYDLIGESDRMTLKFRKPR